MKREIKLRRSWVKVVKDPHNRGSGELWEDNGNGTYTAWGYGLFGCVGTRGKPVEGVEVVPVTRAADRRAALEKEKMLDLGDARQLSMAVAMGGNLNLVKAARAKRRANKCKWGVAS